MTEIGPLAVGALPWCPMGVDVDVEVFDRHNGVPTLGMFDQEECVVFFWKVQGYTGKDSLWLYTALTQSEARQVAESVGENPLDGVIVRAAVDRDAVVGVAFEHRLMWEYRVRIPAGSAVDEIMSLVAVAVRVR
jgi:hypothetical protein